MAVSSVQVSPPDMSGRRPRRMRRTRCREAGRDRHAPTTSVSAARGAPRRPWRVHRRVGARGRQGAVEPVRRWGHRAGVAVALVALAEHDERGPHIEPQPVDRMDDGSPRGYPPQVRQVWKGAPLSSREGGQVTGPQDKHYNLIWFTEQCLSNALRLETYVQDADRIGGLRAGRVLPPGAGREPKGCRAGQAAAASTTVQLTNQSPSSAQRARSPICGTCSEADSAPHPRPAPACVPSIDRVPVRLVFLAIKRRRPERQRQHDEHPGQRQVHSR